MVCKETWWLEPQSSACTMHSWAQLRGLVLQDKQGGIAGMVQRWRGLGAAHGCLPRSLGWCCSSNAILACQTPLES